MCGIIINNLLVSFYPHLLLMLNLAAINSGSVVEVVAVKIKKALIMVDLQNDFCEGGRLAVPQALDVIPLANRLQPCFDIVIATQDWHPEDHMSFASNHPGRQVGEVVAVGSNLAQILWPTHCVQHTSGAALHPALSKSHISQIFQKGTMKHIDSYSAFFDNAHERSTGLADYLRAKQIQQVYIMGLATDYCVKFSVLDALHEGFEVYVIEDACRGVGLQPEDIQQAFNEMHAAGAHLTTVADVLLTNR